MPAVVGAIQGIWASLGAFAGTQVGAIVLRLGLALGTSLISRAKLKKQRQPGILTDATTAGDRVPASVLLGRVASFGNYLCPPYSRGTDGGTPNAWLTYLIDLGDMPIDALEGLIVDGAPAEPAEGSHPDYGAAWRLRGRDDRLWVRFHDGTQTEADEMMLALYGDHPERPWLPDMVGHGIPYAIVTLRYDRELYKGMPRVMAVARGVRLYDLRADTTAGGDGPQRLDDPATWAWTDNPMVIAWNIARGLRLPGAGNIVWGGGFPAADLPAAVWAAAMNACDEEVDDGDGGTAPAWRAGYEATLDSEPADTLDEMARASAAQYAEIGGILKVRVGGPGLPVHTVGPGDVSVTDERLSDPFPPPDLLYNRVHAIHPDPEALWEPREIPVVADPDDEAADGGPRDATLQLDAVTDSAQARRLAELYYRDGRRMRRHREVLASDAAHLEPLDAVLVTRPARGYDGKVFEVTEVAYALRRVTQQVALRERDPADWSIPVRAPLGALPPAPALPAPQVLDGFAVAGIEVEGRRPGLRLSWSGAALDDARGVEWQVRRAGQTEVILRGSTAGARDGEALLWAGILPATAYEARIRLVADRPVAWTGWLGATTPPARLGWEDLDGAIRDELDDLGDATAAAASASADAAVLAQAAATAVAQLGPERIEAIEAIIAPLENIDLAMIEDTRRLAREWRPRGWLADPLFETWASGNLEPGNWAERLGIATYGTKADAVAGGLAIDVPSGAAAVRVVADTTTGLVGADPAAEWLVIGIKAVWAAGAAAGTRLRAEWLIGGVWVRGRIGDVAEALGTFDQHRMAVAPGVVQIRETVVRKPPGSAAALRLWLAPKVGTESAAQTMTIHAVNLREATDAEIAAAEAAPDLAAAVEQIGATFVGVNATIAAFQSDVNTRFNSNEAAIGQNATAITGQGASIASLSATLTAVQTQANATQANLSTNYTATAGMNTAIANAVATYNASVPGGLTATVTQQGVALADVNGKLVALLAFRVAGGGGGPAELELVSADTPGGPVSAVRARAANILLEGSVGAEMLTVHDRTGNIVANGDFLYPDLRGWGSNLDPRGAPPATFSVVSRGGTQLAQQTAPVPHMLRLDPPLATALSIVADRIVQPGQRFSLRFDYAAGGAGRDVTLGFSVRWLDVAGGLVSVTERKVDNYAATAWASYAGTVEAPAGAARALFRFGRWEGGAVGQGYAANIEVFRQQSGAVVIRPEGIEAQQIKIATLQALEAWILNAMIANAAVDTLQIAGQAVTVPVYAYTAADVNVGSLTEEVALQSLTINRRGIATLVQFSASVSGTADAVSTLRLYRGATLVQEFPFAVGHAGRATSAGFAFVDTDTGTGSTTYQMRAVRRTDASWSGTSIFGRRFLSAHQFRR